MKTFKCLLLLSFIVFKTHIGFAYDRPFVAQCLEEQSYVQLLEYSSKLSAEEYDTYLLNATGFAAFQNNQSDKAIHYYQLSLGLDSNNLQANLYLGIINKQQKKYEQSLKYFRNLNIIKPDQPKYFKYLADCYLSLKYEDSALFFMEKSYRHSRGDLNIAAAYADLLYAKSKFTQADSIVNSGLIVDSNNLSLLSIGIKSFYKQKKYNSVLPYAKRVQDLNLGDAIYTPLMFGVFASLQLKNYEQSLSFTQDLMQAGNESEQVFYYSAKACAGLKQYEKSNEFLKKCLELAISENTESYYLEMAENMEQLKRYGSAQKNYDTARFLFGGNLILYRKALAYDAANQKEKAKKTYLDFLKSAKHEDTAVINFARKRSAGL